MKSVVVKLAASALALLGLLWGPASQATGLAELPLKTSVLAKPNVVFAMDDSGSMDWEILLSTDSGLAYWNGSSMFDSATNRPLSVTANVPYGYLFPVGTAAGGALYAYNNWYGQAILPSTQFAWLRSATFNKLYYNPLVTYKPWAPGYVNNAAYFPVGHKAAWDAASTGAAPAHPAVTGAPTANLGASVTAATANYMGTGYRFYLQAGMTVPAGATLYATNATSGACWHDNVAWTERTITTPLVVAAGRTCWASMPWHMATYWHAEDCGTVNATDCILAPDNTTKLKRYEIRATGSGHPGSGRTGAEELQNFANWFTYHRKRKLMLAASMGHALENVNGLRLAVMPFASAPTLSMLDSDAGSNASNRFAVTGQFYLNAMTANATPTHATMKRIGGQFESNTGIIQYACQRNAMFVVTDGFANAHAETAPAYSQAAYGSAAPFSTTTVNSLADLALGYYTIAPRTGTASGQFTAGKVPAGNPGRVNPDTNTNLHVNTYAITLGVRGLLYPNAADPFASDIFTTPPSWPAPVADTAAMIDDLWHATVNGRGKMYLANDVESTRNAISDALTDIKSQIGAQGGVAVSAVNLDRSDTQAYLGVYDPNGWAGDLTANPIDTVTGEVGTGSNWKAAALLGARDWNARKLFSASGSSGVAFTAAAVGAGVNPDSATFTNAAVVDYLRGSRSGEGSTFRQRSSLLGAVVNAEPVLAREEKTVYLASGDGMLHAFDTVSGQERWAFAPPDQLARIGQSVKRGWVYQTLLDATPAYARLSAGGKMMVGGLGAAGRSYYALNVSAPGTDAAPLTQAEAAAQFKWIFPATGDAANRANMGYTVGKPIVTRVMVGSTLTDVVLVTSGYDNDGTIGDGKGRLWMLSAADGSVLKTFRTTAGTAGGAEAGLAHVSAFKEDDGSVRYAYGGDLLGNLWKFDLHTAGAGEHEAFLLAALKDGSGNAQPVTAVPELTMVGGKRVVLVGTGRILDITDFGSSATQTFYAIADGTTLANARSGLIRQTYTPASGSTADAITDSPIDWAAGRGWFIDLPAGQQANTDPVVAYGAVAFVTNVNGSTDCSEASYMYLLDIGTGSRVGGNVAGNTAFVRLTVSETATASRVLALRTVRGKIRGLAHRSDNTVFQPDLPLGQTIDPAKNAWKEIRR